MGGGLMGIGRSKARRYDQESAARVTFDDVAGIDEAENELVEIVDFLKSPEKYTRQVSPQAESSIRGGGNGVSGTAFCRASWRLRSIQSRWRSRKCSTARGEVRDGTTTSTRPV